MHSIKMFYRFMSQSKYIDLFLIAVSFVCLYYFYAASAGNFTTFLGGDGFRHAVVAEQIFEKGTLLDGFPFRLFDERPYPLHYTQYYHLSLGVFNSLLGLPTFSHVFNVTLIVLSVVFIYLSLYDYDRRIAVLAAILVVFINSYRVFLPNFIETYMLFVFTFLFYLGNCYLLDAKSGSNLFHAVILFVYSLGILTITKHMGMFLGIALMGVFMLFVYIIYRMSWKQVGQLLLVFCLVVLPPLGLQLNKVGSIGYATNRLTLPSIIPFSTQLSNTFFSSSFIKDETLQDVLPALGYRSEKEILQYFDYLSNYFTHYEHAAGYINWLVVMIVGLGLLYLTRLPRSIQVLVLTSLFVEVIVMFYFNQRIYQYHPFLLAILAIVFSQGVGMFSKRIDMRLGNLVFFMTLFTILHSYIDVQHMRIYAQSGRNSYSQELLYQQMGEYIQRNLKEQTILLGSSPMLGYYSDRQYIWFREFYYVPHEVGMEYLDQLNVEYIVVSDFNFRSGGLYDHIPSERFSALVKVEQIELVKKLVHGENYIELYKLKNTIKQIKS